MTAAGDVATRVSAAAAAPPPAPPRAWRLIPLLIRFRFRHLWNGFRARRRTAGLLLGLLGLVMPIAYVGLLSQSLAAISGLAGPAVENAALGIMAAVIILASLAGKVASSEAVLAGSAENEFLLTRPVSMSTLVVARSLAGVATDLFDALFLLPILLAATLSWRLGAVGCLIAVIISVAVQVSVSSLAQATQIAVVRHVPPRARRGVWMVLGLASSLTIASLWMAGTWVLREPEAFARWLAPLSEIIALSPAGWLVAPLAALRGGSTADAIVALTIVVGAAAGTVALAWTVARHAGMHGWEEAGAPWAGLRGGRAGRSLGIAAKDLKLLVRDRARLVSLISMPVLFVGVQIFGAAGWTWSTATVTRVALLSFSLCVYMATMGPLTHMQAERRAFWLLRSVPVPIGRLMAAKARVWSLLLGGTGAAAFAVLAALGPSRPYAELIEHGALVVMGAAVLAWLAVALACDAADLSDDQRPAVGPGTLWLFLLLGGLFNVVIAGDAETRLRGMGLLLIVTALTWGSGMERAAECLDAEATRHRVLRPGIGAVMAMLVFLAQRGAAEVATRMTTPEEAAAAQVAALLVPVLLGGAALAYLIRHRSSRLPPESRPRRSGLVVSAAVSLGLGVTGAAVLILGRAGAWPAMRLIAAGMVESGESARLVALAAAAVVILAEELIYRGVLQGALEQRWRSRRAGRTQAAAISVTVSVLATAGTPLVGALVFSVLAATSRALTGRASAAWLVRLIAMAGLLASL